LKSNLNLSASSLINFNLLQFFINNLQVLKVLLFLSLFPSQNIKSCLLPPLKLHYNPKDTFFWFIFFNFSVYFILLFIFWHEIYWLFWVNLAWNSLIMNSKLVTTWSCHQDGNQQKNILSIIRYWVVYHSHNLIISFSCTYAYRINFR